MPAERREPDIRFVTPQKSRKLLDAFRSAQLGTGQERAMLLLAPA